MNGNTEPERNGRYDPVTRRRTRKPYASMTPAEQRVYDCDDVEILRMRDRGASYLEIQRALGVTPKRIAQVVKDCVE